MSFKNDFFKNMIGNAQNHINLYKNNSINSNNSNNINNLYNQKKDEPYFWEYENEPRIWVSILIPSYNTKQEYLNECITSIKEQVGNFGIELVWIDDCSSEEYSNLLVNLLKSELEPLKNIKVVYKKNKINRGISFSLHYGVFICSNEIVFRMDSDDIMLNDRIQKQLNFMLADSNRVICGTNMIVFNEENGIKNEIDRSYHKPSLSWQEYKQNPTDWFLNHPTLCFRKTAILNAGNYRKNFRVAFEDLELELRVLKKFGTIYNLNEYLLLYRRHTSQITSSINNIQLNNHLKKLLIQKMIHG
jgi:glycosyltransferase involved in cell wall biosynthesis